MRRQGKCGLAAVAGAALVLMVSLPAASQNPPASAKPGDSKAVCDGCSVDGKTTPRLPDGHPDLNGFWNGQVNGGIHSLTQKAPDGSILFDFGGGNAAADGQPRAAAPRGPSIADDNPSYKPEYDAKVKAIVAKQYGDSTPDDPQYDCKPLGVPRAMFRGGLCGALPIVQTPQVTAFLFRIQPRHELSAYLH